MERAAKRRPATAGGTPVDIQREDPNLHSVPSSWLSDFPAQDAQIDAALADLRRRQRIADDVNLITWLALNGFEGPSYEEFASELAKYGFAVIKAWIMKGMIFARCREKGLGGLPEPPLGALTERGVADELASETVAKALRHFRDDVLMTGRWDPTRGASIKTFFIGQCLIRFPNIYRSWLTNEVRGDEILLGDRSLPMRGGIGHVDPIDLAIVRQEVELRLRPIADKKAKEAMILSALGWSQREIGVKLNMTEKAVERTLSYYRKRLKEREIA